LVGRRVRSADKKPGDVEMTVQTNVAPPAK
jgi:hypothetical protein